jgi:hypothetical protein
LEVSGREPSKFPFSFTRFMISVNFVFSIRVFILIIDWSSMCGFLTVFFFSGILVRFCLLFLVFASNYCVGIEC